jgi:hypothetical protein
VDLEQGPGIVQYLEIPAGQHRLEGRYRPPGLLPAVLVSSTAVFMVLFSFGYGLKTNSGASDAPPVVDTR